MRLIEDHPVITLWGMILTAASFVGSAGFLVWFLLNLQEALAGVVHRGSEIRHQQEAIRKELATQSSQLTEIRTEQGKIEQRQLWLGSEMNGYLGHISMNIGRILERTER